MRLSMLAASPAEIEVAALAAITELKDAKLIRSKKAEWQLVAAAQAILRGSFSDEFDAAKAMGKQIKQRREVANWVEKLAQLGRFSNSGPSHPSARTLHQAFQSHATFQM